jgi:hypothetical protein
MAGPGLTRSRLTRLSWLSCGKHREIATMRLADSPQKCKDGERVRLEAQAIRVPATLLHGES